MKKIIIVFSVIVLLFITFGCGVTTSNLQQVIINGPMTTSPVRVVDSVFTGKFTARGNLSINNESEVYINTGEHSKVNEAGVYEVREVPGEPYYIEVESANKFTFTGDNFHWQVPSVQGTIDLEYFLTSRFSVTAGMNLSSVNDKSFFGHSFGIALSAPAEQVAFRVGLDLNWQEMAYNAEYLIRTDTYGDDEGPRVYFIRDEGTQNRFNYGVTLLFNTKFKTSPINFFGSLTFGEQSFYDIESNIAASPADYIIPGDGPGDYEFSDGYRSFSGGIWAKMTPHLKFVAGMRYNRFYEGDGELAMPAFFLQMDFDLY